MVTWAARGLYSGEDREGHARLAFLTPESCRCGIFLNRCAFAVLLSVFSAVFLPVSPGRAAGGDIRDQAGQSTHGIERQACVAADVATGRFRQHSAAESEFCRFLQPG